MIKTLEHQPRRIGGPAPAISLCHATDRIQGDGWAPAAKAWLSLATDPNSIEYVMVTDVGRRFDIGSARSTILGHGAHSFTWALNAKRPCPVDAWNLSGELSGGYLLITVSDDWFPPKHWDSELLKALPSLDGEYVLDVDNQDDSFPLLPFSLLTRAYYKRLGYLFYPEYLGNMADCEFTAVARRDRVVIDARHLKFEHRDPSRGAPWDPVYEKQRKQNRDVGLNIFARREKEGFPAFAVEPVTA